MSGKSISSINAASDWSSGSGITRELHLHSLYRHVLKLIQDRRPRSVLEIGCYDCKLLEHLRQQGVRVKGVDIQPSQFDYVLQHDISEPLRLKERFDMIVATEVIEHVVDTDLFFANVRRHLEPDGMAVVTTPNLVSLPNRFLIAAGRIPKFCYCDFHVRMFHPDDLLSKARRHFQQVQERGSHILLGMRHGSWCLVFEKLAARFPRLACHTILLLTGPIAPQDDQLDPAMRNLGE